MKLLFICSRNQWRSPTAAALFEGRPGVEARSAGTEPGARIRVTEGLLGWADRIFVMERKHGAYLRDRFGEALAGREIECLHVPDEWEAGDPELIDALVAALSGRVPEEWLPI
jgi:predicted protein tyrosine phosphatase